MSVYSPAPCDMFVGMAWSSVLCRKVVGLGSDDVIHDLVKKDKKKDERVYNS